MVQERKEITPRANNMWEDATIARALTIVDCPYNSDNDEDEKKKHKKDKKEKEKNEKMTFQKKKKGRGYMVTWDSDGSSDSDVFGLDRLLVRGLVPSLEERQRQL